MRTRRSILLGSRSPHKSAVAGGVLPGTVTGPSSGDLSLTTVALFKPNGTVATDASLPIVSSDGAFTISAIPAGRWSVVCQPAPSTPLAAATYKTVQGFVLTGGTVITISKGKTHAPITLDLQPAGLLQVTVTDSTGLPVTNATILSFLPAVARFALGLRQPPTTDDTGSVLIANVPLRSKLAVLTPNSNIVWWDLAPNRKKSAEVTIPGQGALQPINISLPTGA